MSRINMATRSRFDKLLERVRLQERKDCAERDRVESEIERLDQELVRLRVERASINARIERHDAIKPKLESHVATRSQLEADIAQLDVDMKKQLEPCNASSGSSFKKFFQQAQPIIEALLLQQEEKLKCVRDMERRELALFDEIDAEDIHLPEPTPYDDRTSDESGPVDHGEDRGVPDSASRQTEEVSPLSLPSSSGRQKKRRRSRAKDTPRKAPRLEERSIDIHTFFQNAKSRHRIFRVNGDEENWWIVWCKTHKLSFNTQNPLAGAGKHLHSDSHGFMDKSNRTALAHLGYKVLNCTPELVEANNRAVDAGQEDREPHLPHKGRRRTTLSGDDDEEAEFFPKACAKEPMQRRAGTASQAVLDPKPGEVYLAWIGQNFRAAICLPLPPSVEGTGIAELQAQTEDLAKEMESEPPVCYRRKTDGGFAWAKDYEDHGPKIQGRQHPVVVINNSNVNKWTRAWIPANSLMELDKTDPSLQSVANRSAVLAELRRRKNLGQEESGGMHETSNAPSSHVLPRNEGDLDDGPVDEHTRRGMNAVEDAHGQDRDSPDAVHGEEQTSDANANDQTIRTRVLECKENIQPAAAADTRGESPTADRSRSRQDSPFFPTMEAKIEPPDSCDESQVAAAHSALGSYRDMRSPISSEAMDTDDLMAGENGQLTLTGKATLASMEGRGLLDGPRVLFSHSDVARDFLRGVARDALTSGERDLEYPAPGHEATIRYSSDARASVSYYTGHASATAVCKNINSMAEKLRWRRGE
ncbi:uncharacterized protein J7T54_008564 [Emericellopsis cladophorae]|uniref:Uncharacterized protein n=1 Tax=Emericellopsis cladophorae TaxID=2686198 RepID=A0A9P9XV00_9HYPO|nr:uncharacterized protein J7T54_008564 [Emericellopsis cladophorae]KAI6777914.1 hypothetical protein J7T54_008564 [Emericellopsis cladophorae]